MPKYLVLGEARQRTQKQKIKNDTNTQICEGGTIYLDQNLMEPIQYYIAQTIYCQIHKSIAYPDKVCT